MGNVTYKNSTLDRGIWYDGYALISAAKGSSVPVGTAIGVSGLTLGKFAVCIKATEPGSDDGFEVVQSYGYVECESGDVGFWINPLDGPLTVNFKEV